MPNRNDYQYLKQREAEERLIVDAAGSPVTKRIHTKLAEEYASRARKANTGATSTILNIMREA